jgi:ubiquinone/menaquinone biosynthesis C-methylase UbiE
MEFEHINVKNVYENIANSFSDTRHAPWKWIDDFITSYQYNSNILDIGCGNGRNMINKNYNFYGLDNCNKFVELSKIITPNVVLSEMTSLPFQDNYFDAIISIASFHHLSTIDRRNECLKEMYRVLKPNCKILLSVWSINQSHNKKLNNKFVYGSNIIPWKDNKGNIMGNRYYYIFQINEIYNIINKYFQIDNHSWDHGNEILILKKL